MCDLISSSYNEHRRSTLAEGGDKYSDGGYEGEREEEGGRYEEGEEGEKTKTNMEAKEGNEAVYDTER